jgi:dCTP diphosphatase
MTWTCHSQTVSDLDDLTQRMREFTTARDWEQFHDPKSLILALVGEMGELAELFQWLPADSALARSLEEPLRTRVGEELSDVLLYLLRLADVLGVDLAEAATVKLSNSEDRFRPEDFQGTAPVKG